MMSILIKGMEMPVFEHQSWDIRKGADGKWYMVDTNAETSDGEWHEIVPVPPHGRLGDLDALAERIDGIWDCNDMVFRPNDKICKIPEDCKGCKWAQTKDCIQRMVENAPTIIPASGGKEDE